MSLDDWLLLAAAGLLAGFASGLLGVGGGIVMVPVLHYLLGVPFAEATALSLVVIMIQAPIGIWRHRRKGMLDIRLGALMTVGGAGGVVLGRWLQPMMPVVALKLIFGAVMLFAAYRLAVAVKPHDGGKPHIAIILVLGFVAGVLSKLLGIGGGILTVPVLALLGIPVHVAVASSLIPVWSNATVASIFAFVDGLDARIAIPLAITAVVGAPLGAWAAHALPEKRLRQVVAVALAAVAVLIIATSGVSG